MTVTDPIADMLTRIRNAISVRHDSVQIPASNVKTEIARILKSEGFIENFPENQLSGSAHFWLGKILEKIEFETRSMEEIKKKIKNIKVYKTSYQNVDNRYREHVILYMKTSGLFKTYCVMPSMGLRTTTPPKSKSTARIGAAIGHAVELRPLLAAT